jgi:hypothetical protein
MRTILPCLCLGLWTAFCGAEDLKADVYRYAGGDSVPVFESDVRKIGEPPQFYLRKGDRVKVSGGSGDKDSVVLKDGRTGWIEKKDLTESNRYSLYLEELKVLGFLDNPEPVYILDYVNGDYRPIRVARDFLYDPELMKNIVKENFEWENEIYYYKGYKFVPEAVKPPENLKKQE